MVFLNGEFLPQNKAKISTLDRGFLFGDGVYEVIPVYNYKIFKLDEHLIRLESSLKAIGIKNPFKIEKYQQIITKLLKENPFKNQSIYLQITRGVGKLRDHNFTNLEPTIYIRADELQIRNKSQLLKNNKALIQTDIRWQNCYIKSISLLANVLYAGIAKENKVEEIILERGGVITEGASSNVFILSGEIIKTPKISNNILAGITREMVIQSANLAQLKVEECDIKTTELLSADEVWISSSTREIMAITQINNTIFGSDSKAWNQVYDNFQTLKNG